MISAKLPYAEHWREMRRLKWMANAFLALGIVSFLAMVGLLAKALR